MNELKTQLLLSLALFLVADPATTLASPTSALKRYEAGKYESALREYKRLLMEKPDDPRLHFNAGVAAFQVHDFDEALKQLNSALVTPDLQLQERAYYDLGNTDYRLGEGSSGPDKKQGHWEHSISSYESALKLNPNDQDAKFNLELVKKKLEELQKQQQQKQDQSKKDPKDQQSKEDQKDQSKQDQSKPDEQSKQDQQSKEDQKKQQEQSKSEQQKPSPEKKPEENQAKEKPDSKKDEQKQAQSQKSNESKEKNPENAEDQAQPRKGMMAQMTPQDAQRLLDAQKNEEKTMIFIPKIKTNRTDRVFKDW